MDDKPLDLSVLEKGSKKSKCPVYAAAERRRAKLRHAKRSFLPSKHPRIRSNLFTNSPTCTSEYIARRPGFPRFSPYPYLYNPLLFSHNHNRPHRPSPLRLRVSASTPGAARAVPNHQRGVPRGDNHTPRCVRRVPGWTPYMRPGV